MDVPGRSFISLLHVAPQEHANLATGSDALTVYVLCAALLSRSLSACRYGYELVTNRPELVRPILERHEVADCPVIGHEFALDVPAGIRFHSAHFKLELFSAIGRGAFGEEVAIVDVDGILLRPFHHDDGKAALGVYDISEAEFPAYGRERLGADLEAVAGSTFAEPRWYGGEYISGTRGQFEALSAYVARCWQRYRSRIGTTCHIGDEMVTSAALNLMRADGIPVVEEGTRGQVARWWSTRTLSPQVPLSVAKLAAFLHLPADKSFLARRADSDFAPGTFFDAYARRLRPRLAARQLQTWLERARGEQPKWMPTI